MWGLITNKFQRLCHVILSIDFLFEKKAPEIGDWIWKTFFAQNASGAVGFMQRLSSFLLFLVVNCTLCLGYRALLDLPK